MATNGLKTYHTIIGLDPGVITGVAFWFGQKHSAHMIQVDIFEAAENIVFATTRGPVLVVMEDARKNKRRADKTSDPQAQGAGWVKILSGEFERWLVKKGIDYILKKPQPTKKMSPQLFGTITGHNTLEKESHIRDAAMLVWEYPMTIHYVQPPKPKAR